MIKKIVNRIDSVFPTFRINSFLASKVVRHLPPKSYMDHWSVQPFNGQLIRTRTIFNLASQLKPQYVIETGTYKGTSTIWLAGLAEKGIFTIEIDKLSSQDAAQRFKENYPTLKIELIEGDSAQKIEEVLEQVNKDDSILAYLDAHWLDLIPTKDEINSLLKWNGIWVAVIDDFYNPIQPDYGFDRYGETLIGPELLKDIDDIEIWVSQIPTRFETGAQRGTGYIFSLEAIRILKDSMPQDLVRVK